jgi:predicted enzyme related to lactoylglutathione lyase
VLPLASGVDNMDDQVFTGGPNMMNPVVHFEMPYHDRARAARFYAAAFGWQTQMLGPEMGDYLLVTTAVADVRPGAAAGAINGGMFPFKPDWPAQYPSVVIGVEDVGAAMARVVQAGGEVLGEPMEIPGVGQYVAFIDTEGNRNSMMQPVMA